MNAFNHPPAASKAVSTKKCAGLCFLERADVDRGGVMERRRRFADREDRNAGEAIVRLVYEARQSGVTIDGVIVIKDEHVPPVAQTL